MGRPVHAPWRTARARTAPSAPVTHRTALVLALGLTLLGAGLIALGWLAYRSDPTSGVGRLPYWLVELDAGAIAFACGVVVWVLRTRPSVLLLTRTPESDGPSSVAGAPSVAAASASPIVTDSPSAPAEEGTPVQPLGFLATLSLESQHSTTPSSPYAIPSAIDDEPGSSPSPAEAAPPAAASTPPGPAPAACVRCRIPLSAANAWRKCPECGRSLCAKCVVENLRAFGRGVCDTCGAAGASPAR